MLIKLTIKKKIRVLIWEQHEIICCMLHSRSVLCVGEELQVSHNPINEVLHVNKQSPSGIEPGHRSPPNPQGKKILVTHNSQVHPLYITVHHHMMLSGS